MKIDINISEQVAPVYQPVLKDALNHRYTHYDLSGGRGSTKSSFVARAVILLLLQDKRYNALVLRKVANTLRDSVLAQYQEAVYQLGLSDYFYFKVSPMEIIFKPTGQKILFRGLDDPFKVKSINVARGYIAITHFEEKDQFNGREEIRTVLQSTMRGGDLFWNFETWNPPKTTSNWANKDCKLERKDKLSLKTTYLDVPREWLGQQFFEEVEYLKETSPTAYEHEYLGVPNGNGGMVFENVITRTITDNEIKVFDRIYHGIDWGWYPDPFRWIKMYYNPSRRELFIFDELSMHKTKNREIATILKRKKLISYDKITCDSAEPKSISDLRDESVNAHPAIKGPGSVEMGCKWLQSLNAIIIDAKRAPHTEKEFTEYEYERNKKDGEIMSGYPDANNHSIDAVRYGLESAWRNKRM